MPPIDQNEIFIEPLDIEFHHQAVEVFFSGYEVFDDYVKTRATEEQAHNIAQTHLLFQQEDLIGYYSMSCSKIRVEYEEANQVFGRTDKVNVPALEIPFLAVDHRYQRNGYGKVIFDQVISEAMEIASHVGCRYIILNAVRVDWLIRWYEQNGFEVTVFDTQDNWNLPMTFRIPTIRGRLSPEEDIEAEAGI